MTDIEIKLLNSFPHGFVNQVGEFIARKPENAYFNLVNCIDDTDIKCKTLEWFSRDAFKTEPWRSKKKNDEFHEYMLNGINKFLDTNFTKEDIEIIYQKLGNRINHQLTLTFIKSGYDIDIFRGDTK